MSPHQRPDISLRLPLLLLFIMLSSCTMAEDYYIQISNCTQGSIQEETCMVDSTDELQCMCMADRELSVKHSSTCCSNSIPELGFCHEALCSLDNNVVLQPFNGTKDSNKTVRFNQKTIENLEFHLSIFMSVLQRTLVGVYLRSEEQREICLMAYKQWLCTTKLPLYRESMVDNCACAEVTSPQRVRPCLNVCHNVLQHCPYYIPSKFQPPLPDRGIQLPPNGKCDATNSTEMYEIIYGGYPAFDCPDDSILEEYEKFCQWKQTDECDGKCRESPYSRCTCNCISSGTVSSFSVTPFVVHILLSLIVFRSSFILVIS